MIHDYNGFVSTLYGFFDGICAAVVIWGVSDADYAFGVLALLGLLRGEARRRLRRPGGGLPGPEDLPTSGQRGPSWWLRPEAAVKEGVNPQASPASQPQPLLRRLRALPRQPVPRWRVGLIVIGEALAGGGGGAGGARLRGPRGPLHHRGEVGRRWRGATALRPADGLVAREAPLAHCRGGQTASRPAPALEARSRGPRQGAKERLARYRPTRGLPARPTRGTHTSTVAREELRTAQRPALGTAYSGVLRRPPAQRGPLGRSHRCWPAAPLRGLVGSARHCQPRRGFGHGCPHPDEGGRISALGWWLR